MDPKDEERPASGEDRIYQRLLDKSVEAFILAVELYNRPSIKYHVEGCAFFLCNAWELMLKAYIVRRDGEQAIYYKDNPDRTITLANCLDLVFTNRNDPLRENLAKVLDLRNTSTHFVTDEFEIFYGPILQASVKNFDEKLKELHDRDISDDIPENYLILSVKRDIIDPERIRAKYSPAVAEKILLMNNSVAIGAGEDGNARYSGFYETSFSIVRDPKKADLSVRIEKEAKPGITVVKEVQRVQDKYPFTTKFAIEAVRKRLKKYGVTTMVAGSPKDFNSYHWQEFSKLYGFKSDERYGFNRALSSEKSTSFVYSQQAIELVVEVIKQDPVHAIDSVIEKNKEESRPQEQGNSRPS